MNMFGETSLMAPEYILYALLLIFVFLFFKFIFQRGTSPVKGTMFALWKHCADVNWAVEMFAKQFMREEFDKGKDYEEWAKENGPQCSICGRPYLICRHF